MASFFDLKGTSLQYFYVGLKKLKFDSSALTQERIFYLPDATVTMTGGNIGEVLGITGANAIGWVSITPPSALINVEQNGTLVLSTNTLNFTGAGVAVAQSGSDVDIAISGGGGGNPFDYIQFNLTPPTVPVGAGVLYWDIADGNKTLSLTMEGGNVTQQIGEELYVRVKATAAITNGQVVMITGTVGTSGAYEAQPAVGVTDGHVILGIATESIALNDFGYVTEMGLVRNIITDGSTYGETWVDGDELFWNPNPIYSGGLTNIKPSAPNVKASIGSVVKASGGMSGSIYVRLDPGSELGGTDSNVQIGTLNDNDFLIYDNTLGYWKNITQAQAQALIGGGGGGSYADIEITGTDIDWSLGTTYYKTIAADTTFTFSNIVEGKTITVIIYSSSFDRLANFPTTRQGPGGLDNYVYQGTSTIYTFTRSNGVTYCSSFSGVV
jgi:hypothetical protein